MLKAAAELLQEDIYLQLCDMHNLIISLRLLLGSVILKENQGCLDPYIENGVAFSDQIISAMRPRLFIFSLMNGIGVYLYQTFQSTHLVEIWSTLRFLANYKETSPLETSATIRRDKVILKEPSFLQLTFDNGNRNGKQ